MTTVLGFLSEKIPNRAKAISQFVNELQTLLFSTALATLGLEVFLLIQGDIYALSTDVADLGALTSLQRVPFILTFTLFTLLLLSLEAIFRLFVSHRTAALLPLLPAALLLVLLRRIGSPAYLPLALTAAAACRLFVAFLPHRDKVLLYGTFLLDLIAGYLYLGHHALSGKSPTDKSLFIILAIMTLAALQPLTARQNTARPTSHHPRAPFPFHYFALLGCILTLLPMGPDPLDWSPVIEAGERLVQGVIKTADEVTYHFSSLFGDDSYTAGYSSFDVTGGTINGSSRTQLILEMSEKPYFTYTEPQTSQKMRVRRTLYLAGGRGPNKQHLVNFLNFLYANGVNSEYARLFSQISTVDIEYAYLDTYDEIAPSAAIQLATPDLGQNSAASTPTPIENGVSTSKHTKGYKLTAQYLDIDYGSPYLIDLYKNTGISSSTTHLSYEEACDYTRELYRIELAKILTAQEYEALIGASFADVNPSYTDTTGASDRMIELAHNLTAGTTSDYDKSKLIETYLRQFTYDLNTSGGTGSMSTPEGMSAIADQFLFETGTGYCVHYTASMIMLLRLSGIPARAVAGYRYAFPLEQQDTYEVGGNCAHIWPEAYLPNIGWLPFEPTTIYRTASEFTWHRIPSSSTSGVTSTSGVASTGESQDPEPSTSELPPASDQSQNRSSGVIDFLKITLPVVLSIILLFTALIAGSHMVSLLRYRHGSPESRLKMDVETIKKNISKQSKKPLPDRGLLSDYLAIAPENLRPDIQKVFDAYYRITYGNSSLTAASPITPEENELAKQVAKATSARATSGVT